MAYNATNPNGSATSANSSPVVIASDNVVDTANNQVITTGSITAADAGSTVGSGQSGQALITGTPTTGSVYAYAIPAVNGSPESFSSVVIHITGTFVATYQFERSPDFGVTWTPFSPFIAGQPQASATGTLPGMFHGNISGVTNVRVRATAYTSGTINVRFSYGIGTGTITVGNPIRLYDMANNTQATIKPSSTAPVATDSAIVTAESPNSPLLTGTLKVKLANDVTYASGSITSSTTTIQTSALSGVGSATVSIYGTHAGVNVTFEASDIAGTNWLSVPAVAVNSLTQAPIFSTGVLASNSTNAWNVSPLLGMQFLRVRATAWTSGAASVVIQPSAQFTQPVVNIGSGTVSTTANDTSSNGSLASTSSNVTTPVLNGAAIATIQITGTWAGTLAPQGSVDGSTFVTLGSTSLLNVGTGAYSANINSLTGIWQADIAGFVYFRLNMTSYSSGTAVVTIRTSVSAGMVALDAPLPTGSNTIGAVTASVQGSSNVIGLNPTAGTTAIAPYSNQALSNTAQLIAATNRRMFEYDFYNPNTSAVWVQFFNASTAAAAAFGTNLIRQVYVPASSGRDWCGPFSNAYAAGLVIACSGSNTSTSAPAGSISAYVGYI